MTIAPQQLSSMLRMMPDQELQQYAAMHQNDPYIFPLAFQESQDRKSMRSEAMAQQAGQAKPPVVKQDLAQMAPPQAPNMPTGMPLQGAGSMEQAPEPEQQATKLPEEQGIGTLPANNLRGMADGGITGYADGGSPDYSPDIYKRYALQKAQQMGLDARFVDGIFTNESGYKPNAVPRDKTGKLSSSAVGIGQLKPEIAKYYGIKPEDRMDGFKNIDASMAFMKDLQGKYAGDPQKMAVAYNQGETFLNKHLKANNGQLVPEKLNKPEATNYLKKLGNFIPLPSAQAAEKLPGGAPTITPPGNEWDNPAPQSAGIGSLTSNQAPTYTPEGVEAIGQRLDQAREELKNMRGQGFVQRQKDPNAAVNYQNAKDLVANLQRTYEEGMASAHPELTQAAMIGNPANPQGGTRVLPAPTAYGQQVAQQVAAPDLAVQQNQAPVGMPEVQGYNPAADSQAANVPAPENAPAEDTGKPAAPAPGAEPAAKGGRDWNDFLLNMGLGLMAGKSPYALQNLGEAGIGALRQEQEAKKQGLEERKVAGLEALQKQQGAYYGSESEKNKAIAQSYNDLRGPQAAMQIADTNYKTYMSGAGKFASPGAQEIQRQKYLQEAYNAFGLPMPNTMVSSGKGSDPLGLRN